MSTDELVNAYVEGGMSRRTLIRRLVAAGVSVGAAVSYAHLLSPSRAEAQSITNADFYRPEPGVNVISTDIDAVIKSGTLRMFVHIEEAATIVLIAKVKVNGKLKTVAKGQVTFASVGVQEVALKLTKKGKKLLMNLEKAKVTVFATAADTQGYTGFASDAQKLK